MITKEDFLNYEDIRRSGITNMCAVNAVCDYSGLEKTQVLEIMKDYSALKETYKAEIEELDRTDREFNKFMSDWENEKEND